MIAKALVIFLVAVEGILIDLFPDDCAVQHPETSPCFADYSMEMPEVLECLKSAKPLAEPCYVTLTERVNVTRFCIASNGTVGGWAFRVRSETGINPEQIVSMDLNTTVYSTTGTDSIFHGTAFPFMVAVEADIHSNPNKTIIRKCNIEKTIGPVANLTVSSVNEKGDKSAILHIEEPHYENIGGAIPQNKMIVELVGDVIELSNHGPVPPALINSTFTLVHRVDLSIQTHALIE